MNFNQKFLSILSAFILSMVLLPVSGVEKPAIADFLSSPDIYDAEFSPNGRYLAIILKYKEGRLLVVKDYEQKGAPVIGKSFSHFIRFSSLSWVNNERLVANLLVPYELLSRLKRWEKEKKEFDINKYSAFTRSVVFDLKLTDFSILMENKFEIRFNRNGSLISNMLPHDKEHIIMRMYKRGKLALYKVNVYDGKAEYITKGGYRTYKIITNSEGKPRYRLDYKYHSKIIVIYEYKDKEWEEINEIHLNSDDEESTDLDGLAYFGLSKEDNLIYREPNPETGYYQYVSIDPKTNKKNVIISLPDQDVYSIILADNSNRYRGYQTQNDLIRNVYIDDKKNTIYQRLVTKIGHYNFKFWASQDYDKRVVVRAYGADDPGTYYSYDLEKDKLSMIGAIKPKLVNGRLSIPAYTSFKSSDGLDIRMYILLPPSYKEGAKYPMVVLPHGGPRARDRATYDMLAQFISTRGYIVIQPNFRGSTGYGLQFEKSGFKQWGLKMQDDLTDATQFMIKNGYADPKHICIVGGSYGGYAALMGLIKTPQLFRCAVSMNGVTHLRDQIEHDIDSAKMNEEKVQEATYEQVGHPEKDRQMLDENSPLLLASKITKPLLVIYGEKDKVVPPEQSEDLIDELEDLDRPVESIEIEDTGHHVLYYKEDVEVVFEKIENFLARYL